MPEFGAQVLPKVDRTSRNLDKIHAHYARQTLDGLFLMRLDSLPEEWGGFPANAICEGTKRVRSQKKLQNEYFWHPQPSQDDKLIGQTDRLPSHLVEKIGR